MMSHKARRRPTWKKEPRPFKIHLIDENTGKYMETITITKNSHLMHRLTQMWGPIETEKRLRQMFFDLANKLENWHDLL